MTKIRKRPGESMTSGAEGVLPVSRTWKSRIDALARDPAFRLEWDNDLRYHLARSVCELRRHRGMSQAELAKTAGTTQPKVALVEAGGSNATIKYIEKLVTALSGRIRFGIEPAERSTPSFANWWDTVGLFEDGAQWTTCQVITGKTAGQVSLVLGAWASTPDEAKAIPSAEAGAEEDSWVASFQVTSEDVR